MCVSVCECMPIVWVSEEANRVSDPQELALQAVVSCPTLVLGAASALNCQDVPPDPTNSFRCFLFSIRSTY